MTNFKPGSCVVFNGSYNVRLTLETPTLASRWLLLPSGNLRHIAAQTTHNFRAENILLITSRTVFNNQYINIVGILLPRNKIISFYVLHESSIENIVTKITK